MNRNLSVGLLVSMAAGVLFVAVVVMGEDQALFKPRNEYTLLLPGVMGLDLGSPVKLAGVQVGVVTDIELPRTLDQQNIEVTLGIDRSVSDRIRADTVARMRSLSLLAGDKYIELTLGSQAQPELEPGAAISASVSDFERLATQGTAVADDLAQITSTLRIIFEKIQREEGMLGRLLLEPDFGGDSIDDVRLALASVRRITAQIEAGDGLLGAALSDPELRDRVTGELTRLLTGMNDVVELLHDPETPLGSLLSTEGPTSRTLSDLQDTALALRELTRRIDEGEGLLPRLLSDADYADRLLGDLEATMRNMASITSKIDRGDGTLGALVNDPGVYQGVRDVVTGIQESRMLRWLVDRYSRRGRNAGEANGVDSNS